MSLKNVTKVLMTMVSGVTCSGVRKIQGTTCYEPIGRELRAERLARVENRKQMIEEKGLTVFFHLTSVIFYLTPDTRNLK
jgi:hypothetical protein